MGPPSALGPAPTERRTFLGRVARPATSPGRRPRERAASSLPATFRPDRGLPISYALRRAIPLNLAISFVAVLIGRVLFLDCVQKPEAEERKRPGLPWSHN